MARKQQDRKKTQDERDTGAHQPRPFWSGVITFGLVSLPVSLFPANRGRPVTMNMTDAQGNRVRRRYFNDRRDRMLEREDIVRGYPVDGDRFILVEDEELESLAPEKSREIDLSRFVPLEDINPVFFERGYFLAPDSDATKAYRLLARSLEEEQRAGIATFVMRDREYLIAIMAESGILRAETLRFHDEIRSPQQVGLPRLSENPEKRQVQKIRDAMKARSRKTLNPDWLVEEQVQGLRELAKRKLEKNQDVMAPRTDEPEAEPEMDSNVVDLMQVLKERLQGQQNKGSDQGSKGRGQREPAPETELSRDELYEQARKKGIPGRSKMNKRDLVQALQEAG